MNAASKEVHHPQNEDDEADGVGRFAPTFRRDDAEFKNGVGEVIEQEQGCDGEHERRGEQAESAQARTPDRVRDEERRDGKNEETHKEE